MRIVYRYREMEESNKVAIRNKIDDLLGKGIQYDQVIILQAEQFLAAQNTEISKLMKDILRRAIENARTIDEARKIIFTVV